MVADLSGYTRLSSELDPEEVHRLLTRYFELADSAVRHFGGHVDKHIGDAVMAVFGAPIAHGNDAERAVRAAVAIIDRMHELSQEFGRSLLAHIGMAAGEVVAAGIGSDAHRQYTVTGDAVNLAARLDEIAKGGEGLVSGPVYSAVAPLVEAQSRGTLTVRGLVDPVAVWEIVALRERAPEISPLVGRAAECRQFASRAAEVREAKRGCVLLLRGEAGFGKSRLLNAFLTSDAATAFAVHRAMVLDFGVARGEDATATLVAGLLDCEPGAGRQGRAAALLEKIQAAWFNREQAAFLAALLDLALDPDQRQYVDAMDNAAGLAVAPPR
jgi:class 3 adenylate cyclase